jgi:hypothetical protein
MIRSDFRKLPDRAPGSSKAQKLKGGPQDAALIALVRAKGDGTNCSADAFQFRECWPWLNAVLWLSCGQNFSPAPLPGFSFFAAAFIARLTSAQVPSERPHALHNIIKSSVGSLGISSRLSHLEHLNLSDVPALGIFIRATRRKAKSKG